LSVLIPPDLYAEVLRTLPIACVDLLVRDEDDRVLLLKRANAPARNEWWFPGGRIHYFESRIDAARRKLQEECGLVAGAPREIGTWDVFFDRDSIDPRHAVTTLFEMRVPAGESVRIDEQSLAAEWKPMEEWLRLPLQPFVQARLEEARR
jgi:colanic acid biosynthesis protein WcaH